MHVVINGQDVEIEGDASLRDLLIAMRIDPDQKGMAAAVNDEVIPRSTWATAPLSDRDRVEIIHAVQGG